MERARRHNVILAVCLAAVGVFLAIWGCPYMRLYGHAKLCIFLYALLIVVFVYGRASTPRRPGARAE